MITMGQKIRLRRRERGLTQKALSELCLIPQPNLSNMEKDLSDITVLTLKKLAKALAVRPSELIDDDSSEYSQVVVLTRERIERIAEAVQGKRVALSDEEAKVVMLFKNLLPEPTSRYVSLKKLHDSWLQLRAVLSKKQIENIYGRIHDVKARDV